MKMFPRGGRLIEMPDVMTFRPNGLFRRLIARLVSRVAAVISKNSNQPYEMMLVRSPMNHSQLYMFWPKGLPKLSRLGVREVGGRRGRGS